MMIMQVTIISVITCHLFIVMSGWNFTIEGSPVHLLHTSPCNLHFGPASACLRSMAWFSLMTV